MTTALLLKIGADVSSLRGELNKANGLMNQFTGQMANIGKSLAGVFTVGAIVDYTMEASRLAGEMEGVENAFRKLDNSTKLLKDLKDATAGTVSELNLMKRAVAFSNFGLELEQLPKLLQFATLRAQQTGQSVDYLVDSIVTGLGRKSVLILDNLGISASMLNEEVARTGDFMQAAGNIVNVELRKMGNLLDTSVTASDKLSAATEDLKVAFGELVNSAGWTAYIQNLAESLRALPKAVEWNVKLAKSIFGIADASARGAETTWDETKPAKYITTLKSLEEELTALKDIYMQTDITDKSRMSALDREIKLLELKIQKIKGLNSIPPPVAAMAVVAPTISTDIKDYGFLSEEDYKVPMEEMQKYFDDVTPEIAQAAEGMKYIFIDMSQSIQSSLAGLAVGLGESIGNMIAGVGGIEQIAAAVVGGLGNMAMQLGQTMIQFGLAGLALKKFAITPGAAIAAGVALVALGRVLSAKATGIAGGGGSSGGGGGASSPAGALTKIQYGNRVEVTGEFELRNDRLVAAIRNENRRTERTLPTSRG